MNLKDFDAKMRALEHYHSLVILSGAWVVLRLDGRGFSKFTEKRFEKPFDPAFHALMKKTSEHLLEELGAIYGYTESDEISLLFRPEWDLFDRELEKLVSVSAGLASAVFTHLMGEPAHFDNRVWVGVNEDLVCDYFLWRQADARRCALNGWCYWTLRKKGSSVRQATAALEGKSVSFKNELLFEHGINFNEVPCWQRRGIGLFWERYEKEGFNPKTQQTVKAIRRRIRVGEELPMKEEYRAWIQEQVLCPEAVETGRG